MHLYLLQFTLQTVPTCSVRILIATRFLINFTKLNQIIIEALSVVLVRQRA